MMNKRGGGSYRGTGSGHIVITGKGNALSLHFDVTAGNPSAENLKAVLLEIFHPDHCVSVEAETATE